MRSLVLLPLAVLFSQPVLAAAPLVYIDAGHGGVKDGAVGPKKEKEKDITLQVVLLLREEMLKRGVRVELTRETDVDVGLKDRIRMANEAKADAFVSVHCNSMPLGPARKKVRGIETYFLSAEATNEQARRVAALENAEAGPEEQQSDDLSFILNDLARTMAHRDASSMATYVHQQLVKDLKARDRKVQQAPFFVLMGAQMPAVLVEIGFLSHPSESRKLTQKAYQEQAAAAIATGLTAFLADMERRSATTSASSAEAGAPAETAQPVEGP